MLMWPGWSARWLSERGSRRWLIRHEVRLAESKEDSLHFNVIN
jgi:hypothetical protein